MILLLEDTIPLTYQICEMEASNGARKLRGLFHLAEKKNANGRIYSRKLLEREYKRILPAIKNRQVLGEISHPSTPEINLERASHLITNLKMDGNKLYGEMETLTTPSGKTLEALIDSNVKLGISSRGLGSLQEDAGGTKVVQEDYSLITWDVVPNPSTPDAWLGESEELDEELFEAQQDNKVLSESYKIKLELMKNIDILFGRK